MATHDFQERLAFSHKHAGAAWWPEVYHKAFGKLASMACVRNDGWAQRAGIDRIIVLASGKVIKVDEKVRSKNYPDFALEQWSDEARKSPGWIQKPLDCDFIAYAFVQSGLCYLFPTLLLQRAWRQYGREWLKIYEPIRAQNKGYVTLSLAVPKDIVLDAIREVIVVSFEGTAA